ncbi:transcriptional repressor [Candidatus Woesearchaeota archaeon]|nr:transcriptional repressor [Candidatus Woesearchaeota archaeon]
MTNQRLKIMNYLKKVRTHPTAEQVYEEVKKELPAITLATVYRNLHLLADQGDILKLEINKEFHFDADTCKHQHFICRKCGKIIDIMDKDLSEYALEKVSSKNFKPECVTIIFRGICKNCRR